MTTTGMLLHSKLGCLAQPSSEKLPPVADGKEDTDPQPDIKQRVMGDLGTLGSKCSISIRSLGLGLREPCRRGGQTEYKNQKGWRTQENKARL